MDVHRTGKRYTFGMAAPAYYRRRLRHEAFDLILEDLNKVPLFAPIWSSHPLVLLVHHLFGRTAFEEAPVPLATATWMLEKPLPRFYRGVPIQAVSRSTADDLIGRGFPADDIEVIPNGVDLDYYSPDFEARSPDPMLLYLGRLKKYKRIDLLLRAVALLRDGGIEVRAVIAGRGDYEPALRKLRSELDLEQLVDMPGFVSEEEKRQLFRKTWIHVLTSTKEGWGITNIEAAACGTPTVASNSPGLRDSVVDGTTGFLVPHGDVQALAGKLESLLQNEGLVDRMGRQAREFAQEYSWEAAADRTEAHLRRTISQAG